MTENPFTGISRFIDDVVTDALSARLNAIAGAPAPLVWRNRQLPGSPYYVWKAVAGISGQAGADYDDDQIPDVLARWAALLNLSAKRHDDKGVLTYTGTIDGTPVEVWGIADRDAWDAGKARRPGAHGEGDAPRTC